MSEKAEDAAPGPSGPRWMREAWTLSWEEVRSFVRTGLGFLRRPGRFSADWVTGKQRALNPLGFVATSLAVSSVCAALVPHNGSDGGLATQIALATLPYCYYVCLGVVAHPLLRLGGSRRGISSTLAISLFAGGGPGLLSALAIYLVIVGRRLIHAPFASSLLDEVPTAFKIVALVLLCTPVIALVVTLVLGLAGAHGIRRWRATIAVLLSIFIVGSTLGFLHQRVQFSLGVPHFVVTFMEGTPNPDIWF